MNAVSPLCITVQKNVKEFFQGLHGHQSKTLSMFVLGAIRAGSIVLPKVAEALLEDSDAKSSSIERRLERFLSNPRIHTEEVWKPFLDLVMPYFQKEPIQLVIDLTPYEEHAQVIYVGMVQYSRVLPLVWKVMPGQTKWDERLWDIIRRLFERLAPYLENTDCTLIGDSAFGCFPMVQLCQKMKWHYLFRICPQHTCEHWSAQGRLLPTCPVSELVSKPGKRFYGAIRLWRENQIETNLSGYWEEGQEEALLVISDRPACQKRLLEYKSRWKVESTFEDLKSRGWNWEESHVRALDRVDHLLLVLFLMLWWLVHLAGSCIHNGRRDRYDRHDRRDKNIFRIGRLYLLDIERKARRKGKEWCLKQCLIFRGKPGQWHFSLRF
jgi:hypothetical protein